MKARMVGSLETDHHESQNALGIGHNSFEPNPDERKFVPDSLLLTLSAYFGITPSTDSGVLMSLIISYVILAAGAVLAAWLLAFAIRLLRSDKMEGSKSAARARTLINVLLGKAHTRDDWIPDARVKGGMVYNKKKKRIEISGRLSDDSLDRVFRSPRSS
jgi:hypothetical protein